MKIKQSKSEAAKKLFRNGRIFAVLSGGSALLLVFLAGTKYLTKTFCEIFSPDIFDFAPAGSLSAGELIKKGSACALCDIICVMMMIPAVYILFNLAVMFISDKDKSVEYRSNISLGRIYSCAWSVLWRWAAAIAFTFGVYYICGELYKFASQNLGGLIPEMIIILLCGFPVCLSVLMCTHEISSLFPLVYISIIFYDVSVKKALQISREVSRDHHTRILLFNLSFIALFVFSYLSFGVILVMFALPFYLLSSAIFLSRLSDLYKLEL